MELRGDFMSFDDDTKSLRAESRMLGMSLILGKLGLMHVHKVSSQISMCSQHRLIRLDFFPPRLDFHLHEREFF